MNYCVFYFSVLLIFTIYALRKKINIIGLIILVLYTTIGGISIFACQEERLTWCNIYMSNLKLYPFILLLIAYAITFKPFLCSRKVFNSGKIVKDIDDRYKFLLIVYIVCSILCIINYAATVISIIRSGNLAGNYRAFALGGEGEFHYYNFVFYIATQISIYNSLLCLIMAFLFLREKKHIKLSFIAITVYFLSNGMIALYVSARGMIFEYAMIFAGLSLFLFPNINQLGKKALIVIGIVAASVLVPYLINVTVSRFTSAGAWDSILTYFGQPPLVFNGAVQSLDRFHYGEYALSYLFGHELNPIEFGHIWVRAFYTFVGYFYIDWGIPGIIIIGSIISYVMRRIIRKKNYNVSDLLLIFAFYKFLVKGSLVIGNHYILDFAMTMVLYVLIRVFVEGSDRKIRITIRGKRI